MPRDYSLVFRLHICRVLHEPNIGFPNVRRWHTQCNAMGPGVAVRPRVIIALPNITECGSFAGWLVSEGFEPVRRSTPRAAAEEMQARSFDLLIADAAFAFRDGLHAAGRRHNPLTPTVVVGDPTAAAQSDAVGRQAMFLARPVERVMLVCTVSMAMMDGRPARRSMRKLVKPLSAVVNGVPSHIVDVSNEGLRLAMPRDRRWVPPPYFSVRVPLIGTAVTVQRMWTRAWPGSGRTEATWCGVELIQNGPLAERAWRGLVDTIPLVGSSAPDSLKFQ